MREIELRGSNILCVHSSWSWDVPKQWQRQQHAALKTKMKWNGGENGKQIFFSGYLSCDRVVGHVRANLLLFEITRNWRTHSREMRYIFISFGPSKIRIASNSVALEVPEVQIHFNRLIRRKTDIIRTQAIPVLNFTFQKLIWWHRAPIRARWGQISHGNSLAGMPKIENGGKNLSQINAF